MVGSPMLLKWVPTTATARFIICRGEGGGVRRMRMRIRMRLRLRLSMAKRG
jgi:hypothetical protein